MFDEFSLNIRAMLVATLRLAVIWGSAVAMVVIGGFPGVVCVTPMAWLLVLPAARNYIIRYGTPNTPRPVLEITLVAATAGILYGLIFLFVANRFMDARPDELGGVVVLSGIMVGVGAIVCAALAFTMAFFTHRQLQRAGSVP